MLFLNNLFIFLAERSRVIFLLLSIAILIEGLLYIFFPQKIKEIIEQSSLCLIRFAGILVIIIALILIILLQLVRGF